MLRSGKGKVNVDLHHDACPAESVAFFWVAPGITGTLLGGYGAVELVKRLTGYNKATGDRFAVIAPLGLALGRDQRLQGQLFYVYFMF